MKIGDLVVVRKHPGRGAFWDDFGVGVIIDVYDNPSVGIINYEVKFEHETGWFDPLELEVVSESR
tara:strand:+ start:655 stop:849 length:195 start_codon:yes stop_codon:yes gene_type:complete